MDYFLEIIWILILLQLFVPFVQRRILIARRQLAIKTVESKRRSRVITMIHRQETMSLLGFPIARYIDIEDSERLLRAIRLTEPDVPIDLVLHTPGGLVLASEQIACALCKHPAEVTVFVPHYAMSGGTLLALAADMIVMDPNAVLGPVDPQLGSPESGYYPGASVLAALQQENPNRDDSTLILGDIARKAAIQVRETIMSLLKDKVSGEKAELIASSLSEGRWTHDYPIGIETAEELGLPVTDEMPREVYDLMDLYPQTRQRRPSVEFVPTPYKPVAPPSRRERE